jgi:hypothetical protein
MNQELGTSADTFGMAAGKAILMAGLVLLGYCVYAISSGSLGYQICPQFRGSVVIGSCGNPPMYTGYVVSSIVSIVLGTFLHMMSEKTARSDSPDRTKLAVRVLFALVAVLLLASSVLLIALNFHTDFYS